VRITDSSSESSTKTIDLFIADLPFEEKPLELQLQTYISDPAHLQSVTNNIEQRVTDAINACKANPASCGIKPKTVIVPLF